MKKIVIITATYPTKNDYGGAFIKDQCKMLIKMGYDVSVLYAAAKPLGYGFKKRESCTILDDDIPIYIDYSWRLAATYTVPLLKQSIIKSCSRLFQSYIRYNDNCPDIIISNFSYPAGIGAAYLSKKYNIPLISIEHLSLLLNPKARPWINRELKYVYNQASEFICVSEGLKDGLEKRLNVGGEKIIVIPNTIDPTFTFHPLPMCNKKYSFLSVGSLRPIKNFPLLIKAFSIAFSSNENVELRIVGEGPQREELQALINEYKLEQQVFLLGGMNRKDLYEEYKKCNCFILLSQNETFGVSYREAMAVGRPVISSNNGGINYGWDNEFGLIVPTFDVNIVASTMREITNKRFNYVSISQKTHDLYSLEKVGEKYRDIIEKLTYK